MRIPIGFGGTINKEGQPRSQVLSPTRRETLVGSVSTWRVLTLTCLPESGRLQTNVLREGQIIVRFVSAERWSKVQSWNCDFHGHWKTMTLGNLRTTTTTLSRTTGSEIPCTAQARWTNFVVVVSPTTPNTVESRHPAVHKLLQV